MRTHELRRTIFEKCLRHIPRAIEASAVYVDPFPHVFVAGFFPDDIYGEMLGLLPPQAAYDPFYYEKHLRDDGSPTRFRFPLLQTYVARLGDRGQQFWLGVRDALGCVELKRAVYRKLSPGLKFRYSIPERQTPELAGYPEPVLQRELAGYRIAPHPDTRRKVVTMQIALPADDSQRDLGTEFYRRSVNPWSFAREPRGFAIVKRAPFLPNAAYAFSVLNSLTWKSWHGRTTLDAQAGVRNSLLNIWYETPEFGNPEIVAEHYPARTAA